MLYELRVYPINPGHRKDIEDLFEHTNLANFKRHGISVEGLWYSTSEEILYYILKFEDEDDQKAKWEAFYADPVWAAGIAKWQDERGNVMDHYEHYNMEPIPFYDEKLSRF